MKNAMNNPISINPKIPSSLKFTAHGYMKITSTSKITNKIATRKYFIEKGIRALPCDSIPHSKLSCLIFECLFGPNKWVTNMVVTTNPAATMKVITMGRKSRAVFSICTFKHFKFRNFPKLSQYYFISKEFRGLKKVFHRFWVFNNMNDWMTECLTFEKYGLHLPDS